MPDAQVPGDGTAHVTSGGGLMVRRVLLVVSAVGLGFWSVVGVRAGQQRVDEVTRALAGAIDIHVHSLPDSAERSVDGLEAAVMARAHGMRGLVLKNHYDPTGGLAYMVRKQVPGLDVFGGV